jgi:hypothetical protein
MNQRINLAIFCGLVFGVWACGGGSSSDGGGSAAQMDVVEASHGFGQLLPHQIFKVDGNGFPSGELIPIRTEQDLIANVTLDNPVLSVASWPQGSTLPNGAPGNHFIYVRFSQPIEVNSVMDSSPTAQGNSNLRGTITVVAQNVTTGSVTPLRGRAFIGGQTYAGVPSGSPPALELQKWIDVDALGKPIALDVNGSFPGLGFPGTESAIGFSGSQDLARPETFVFVADTDGDMTTHERFPTGAQIKLKVTTSVRAQNGSPLVRQAATSSTVGMDSLAPEVATAPPPLSTPQITPGNGDPDIDPTTNIVIEFSEPIQPLTVGPLPSDSPPPLSSAIQLSFGPTAQSVTVPFSSVPLSVLDLSTYRLVPAFNFPGAGPDLFQCGTFNRVDIRVNSGQFRDLSDNANSDNQSTFFFTGEGPGLVNAPVAPDVIYLGRSGATPGISVIDLNGFGASTGNPTFVEDQVIQGNTNYPNNPNFLQDSQVFPQLRRGTCTFDGGSAGVFTLTKDSSLQDLLIKSPLISSIGEMMIGNSLDVVFNNGQESTGCQSGGGNLCAINGKKVLAIINNTLETVRPPQLNETATTVSPGAPNTVTWAPHPNPPPLVFPPLCLSPYIGAQEPTSIEGTPYIPTQGTGLPGVLDNLLVPGDPFGNPAINLPPSGILSSGQNAFFVGPGRPGQALQNCVDYMMRQQVGHFLYMIDRSRRELVVLNSNRFTVLDRIVLPDPTSLAMSPNVDFLAVSNQGANSVSFVNIDPTSSSFHQIVTTTVVGIGPRGIAWDPRNEDILVCNEAENTVSIISAFSFQVRRVVGSQLNRPFDVAITPRQNNFGFFRDVYFAWIANRDGRVALFESGPNGINGWGFDDIIGVAPFTFADPKVIQPDPVNLNGGCWIVHEDEFGNGAVSNLVIDSTTAGRLILGGNTGNPQLRDISFEIRAVIDSNQLTGLPVDMAFDNLTNVSAYGNTFTDFSAGTGRVVNGKTSVMFFPFSAVPIPANSPAYMFLAIPNSSEGPGVVDVIDTNNGFQRFDTSVFQAGIQSIPAFGVTFLSDYFKQ